jgi:hypothetical protein
MALLTFNTLTPMAAVKKPVITNELIATAVTGVKRTSNESTSDKIVTCALVFEVIFRLILATNSHLLRLALFSILQQI